MMQDTQFQNILYFLVFFKFIFIIFYSLHVYGILFDHNVYENTFKWVVGTESIFMIAMSVLLLYRFSKDSIQINMEERFLIWTLTFVIVWEELVKVYNVEWF